MYDHYIVAYPVEFGDQRYSYADELFPYCALIHLYGAFYSQDIFLAASAIMTWHIENGIPMKSIKSCVIAFSDKKNMCFTSLQ